MAAGFPPESGRACACVFKVILGLACPTVHAPTFIIALPDGAKVGLGSRGTPPSGTAYFATGASPAPSKTKSSFALNRWQYFSTESCGGQHRLKIPFERQELHVLATCAAGLMQTSRALT